MEKYKYLHYFHLNNNLHKNYSELIASNTLRSLALSLISLFLPIYLIEIGFDLKTIFILELLMLSLSLILHFYTFKIVKTLGIKKTLILSYFCTIIFYVVLYNSDFIIFNLGKSWFLFLTGLINVLFTTLFWIAQHLYFVKTTKKSDSGKKYGALVAVPMILGIASPFIGGILIENFSFKLAFVIAGFLIFIGGIILFLTKEIKTGNDKLKIKNILTGKGSAMNMMYFIEGSNVIATGFIWPVLLFSLSVKIIFMGVLYLFSNTIYAVISYYGGEISDKNGPVKLVRIGSIGHGLSLIFRAFSKTTFFITGFQSMGGLFGALWTIPFQSNFYKECHVDPMNRIMNMELYQHLGRIFMFLLILVLSLFVSPVNSLIFALIFSGILTFGFSFLLQDKN